MILLIVQEAVGPCKGQWFLEFHTICEGGCPVCDDPCKEPVHESKEIDAAYVETMAAALDLVEVPKSYVTNRRVSRVFK